VLFFPCSSFSGPFPKLCFSQHRLGEEQGRRMRREPALMLGRTEGEELVRGEDEGERP